MSDPRADSKAGPRCALCTGKSEGHAVILRETTRHTSERSAAVTIVRRSDRLLLTCEACVSSVERIAWERRILVAVCAVLVATSLGAVVLVGDESPRGVVGGLIVLALISLYGVVLGGPAWLERRSGQLIDRAPELRSLVSDRRAGLPASATFTLEPG